MIKLTFFFAAIVIGLPFVINEVEAQKGQFSDNVLIPFNSTQDFNEEQQTLFKWTSHPERILDNGQWLEYILTVDANTIRVETAQGSFEIDKNTCEFAFYNNGKITGSPTIVETYQARQSTDGVVWSEVNQINNAPCQTFLIEDGENIEVQTIKSHALGEMKIRYIKNVGQILKSQMEVTNTSGLNDRYFGFFQLMQVPQSINFGGNTINLASKNGTFYDRTFIIDNKAKLIKLASKIQYDFDKAFSSLNGITVIWDGSNAFLEFDYSFNAQILPDGQTFVIDPTYESGLFASVNIREHDFSATCDEGLPTTDYTNVSNGDVFALSGVTGPFADCYRSWDFFDTSSIGPNATYVSGNLFFNLLDDPWMSNDTQRLYLVTSYNLNLFQRNVTEMFDDIDNDLLVSTYDPPNVPGPAVVEFTYNFNRTELDKLQTRANNWTIIGYRVDDELTPDPLFEWGTVQGLLSFQQELTFFWYLGGAPDEITDLSITSVGPTDLDLLWTEPFMNGTFVGYQINFTSPHGDPLTVIVNSTLTDAVRYDVLGLTQLTNYSFRVGTWNNNTGTFTGNIANTTTTALGNFTVGFFSFNATQADARDFKYVRVDLNSTYTNLEVTYPTPFNTSCNFAYKFAMTNNTFFNLSTNPAGPGEVTATFQFQNIQNEVINVQCTDETSGVTAPYLLTITSFPLLQQFINFSDGTYGTMGNFGAIDLVTLGVIIIMMVGFNRVNESVGAIFAVIILGFFSFFDIVEWQSFMFGTFAVVIMLTIASTRKM